MGNALPDSSSLSYPDRRGWVIAFGVIEILLGLGCLLVAVSVGVHLIKAESMAQIPQPASMVGFAVAGGVYLLLSAFFLVAGIGSVRCKNWARILMLIGSGIWLAFGVLGVVAVSILLPRIMAAHASAPSSPPSIWS